MGEDRGGGEKVNFELNRQAKKRPPRFILSPYQTRGLTSRPTRTRSVLERSPMIFLSGGGSFLTSVGMARIRSP